VYKINMVDPFYVHDAVNIPDISDLVEKHVTLLMQIIS
jgi:hypothetical protein